MKLLQKIIELCKKGVNFETLKKFDGLDFKVEKGLEQAIPGEFIEEILFAMSSTRVFNYFDLIFTPETPRNVLLSLDYHTITDSSIRQYVSETLAWEFNAELLRKILGEFKRNSESHVVCDVSKWFDHFVKRYDSKKAYVVSPSFAMILLRNGFIDKIPEISQPCSNTNIPNIFIDPFETDLMVLEFLPEDSTFYMTSAEVYKKSTHEDCKIKFNCDITKKRTLTACRPLVWVGKV